MLSNKRYQIFVSSTQADLRDEREAIINSLTKIGYIAVGMEQFPATDEEQMDYIRPVIDESDYYIVIIKGRYGSIGSDGISYTEKEFRYAVETKKPALAFLFKDLGSLKVSDTDADPEKMQKLNTFRAELEQKRIVKYWFNSDELVASVKDSINDLVRRRPATGWIRGDQALDPEVYRERDELRKEIESLKQRLASLNGSSADDLARGDDKIDINYQVLRYIGESRENPELLADSNVSKSCDDILSVLMDRLYPGSDQSEDDLKSIISKWIIKDINNERGNFKANKEDSLVLQLPEKTVERLRYHFEALGLITCRKLDYRTEFYWRLTDKGRTYIANMYAFKKPAKA